MIEKLDKIIYMSVNMFIYYYPKLLIEIGE